MKEFKLKDKYLKYQVLRKYRWLNEDRSHRTASTTEAQIPVDFNFMKEPNKLIQKCVISIETSPVCSSSIDKAL